MHHSKLVEMIWKAIFTTNFDICFEMAEASAHSLRHRLLPIANPNESPILFDHDPAKLKYFKIHGCCKEIEQHPTQAAPLVITQKDYQDSIARNQPFIEQLKSYAYDCSIVFVGFQAQKNENNYVLGSLKDITISFSSLFHQSFKPFAVLPGTDQDTKEDLEEIGINLLDGSFEEFIDIVYSLQSSPKSVIPTGNIDDSVHITAAHLNISLTRAEYQQYESQFSSLHDNYFDEKREHLKKLDARQVRDLWKADPTDMFLATGRYFGRSTHDVATNLINKMVDNVKSSNSPCIIVIHGDRASGKTVLAKQLASHAFANLNQPVLFLNPEANYYDKPDNTVNYINISGWDNRIIDKFLSFFYSGRQSGEVVPILIADHVGHRQFAIDHLLSYLENHGKHCILMLTLNSDEWISSKKDRLFQIYEHKEIPVPTKWDDQEIATLFDQISHDEPRILAQKKALIDRAKSSAECDRDILFILYAWFDRQFRRLDDIITDEIGKLSANDLMRNLYSAIAVFHQYSFSPRVSLCAESVGIDINAFAELRKIPIFKAFISLHKNGGRGEEYGSTRHSEFSRRIVEKLSPPVV